MNKVREKSVFDRNPVITLVITSFLFFFMIDLSFTFFSKKLSDKKNQLQQGILSETRISHPVYHHTFKANSSEVIEHDILRLRWQENTNSLGFKDNKVRDIKLKTDQYRVIFIGDSITEGIGYTYDETFVGIISNYLNNQNIEVLNASRVSYSPIIYWRKIKYLIEDVGLNFDELVVLIDMSDIQDEYEIYQLDENLNVINKELSENYLKARELVRYGDNNLPFTKDEKLKNILVSLRELISKNTTFIYYITNSIYDLIFDEKSRVPYLYLQKDYTRFSWPYYEKAYLEFAEGGIESSINYMNMLLDLLEKHNIQLTVGVYPLPNNIYFDNEKSKHANVWEEWTSKKNVRFFNMFPGLVDRTRSDEDKIKLIDKYYIKHDMHFNDEGHKMFASKFLEFYNYK